MRKVKVKENIIGYEAVARIAKHISSVVPIGEEEVFSVVDMAERVWMNEMGTYPKRVRALIKEYLWEKLSPEDVSIIGNMAKEHSLIMEEFGYDFTRNFNWNAGDFGDQKSCFWGEGNDRDILSANGFEAFRVYNKNGEGVARCWVKREDDFIVAFNGYGIETRHLAEMIRTIEEYKYKKEVHLTINCGGLSMYVNDEVGHILTNYELKEEAVNIRTGNICERCGSAAPDTEVEGERICWGCSGDKFETCFDCLDIVKREEGVEIVRENMYCFLCSCCWKWEKEYQKIKEQWR